MEHERHMKPNTLVFLFICRYFLRMLASFFVCVCEIEAANLLRVSQIIRRVARKIAKSFILMATCRNSILAVFRGTWHFLFLAYF